MESYIPHLQEDVQNIIREELPYYAKLNKKYYAGSKIISKLCYKDISKKEIINYIIKYSPIYIPLFYEKDEIFSIIDIIKNGNTYNIITHTVSTTVSTSGNSKINVNTDTTNNNFEIYQIIDYIMEFDKLYVDLFTTFNIIKHMRKQCLNVKDVMINFLNNHVIINGKNHLEFILNTIKSSLLLFVTRKNININSNSNYTTYINNTGMYSNNWIGIIALVIALKNKSIKAEFINGNYYNDKSYRLMNYLEDNYNSNIVIVEDFINNL